MNPRLTLLAAPLMLASCATSPVPTAPIPSAPVPSAPALPTAFDAGWRGERVCEPLYENAKVRAARCTFPPGGGHERHSHPPHWGYILQGGTMRIASDAGSVERVLKSGASWWSDGITWHEPVNIGTETAVYIIVEPK